MVNDTSSASGAEAPPALVPVHPEPIVANPLAMRWVVPPDVLDFVGGTARVPAALQALVDDHTIDSLRVEATAVVTTLSPGSSWRAEGERVRGALQTALAQPARWQALHHSDPDDVLRAAVAEVIAGDVGEYVRSHGGQIELVDVCDGRVRVRLNGACTHCPASRITLGDRFETALRARCPSLVSVTQTSDAVNLPVENRRRLPMVFSRRS